MKKKNPPVKQIMNENLLYSTGNPTQHSVITDMEKKTDDKYTDAYGKWNQGLSRT